MHERERRGIRRFPLTATEALDELERDEVLIGGARAGPRDASTSRSAEPRRRPTPRRTRPSSSTSTSSSTEPPTVALDLDAIPIVDNHCHSLLRRQPPDDEAFRIHLTESTFPEIARDHVPTRSSTTGRSASSRRCSTASRPRTRSTPRGASVASSGSTREIVERRELQDLADRHGLRRRHDVLARRAARPRPVPDRGGPPPRAADRAADPRRRRASTASSTPIARRSPACVTAGSSGMKSVHRIPDGLHIEDVERDDAARGVRGRARGGEARRHAADRVEAAARPPDRDRRRGGGPAGRPDPVPHRDSATRTST